MNVIIRSLPNAGTRALWPRASFFVTFWNPVEHGPTAGMYVCGFTVCSFMFSCASVKMLIDNCVAPPPTAVGSDGGCGAGGGRGREVLGRVS